MPGLELYSRPQAVDGGNYACILLVRCFRIQRLCGSHLSLRHIYPGGPRKHLQVGVAGRQNHGFARVLVVEMRRFLVFGSPAHPVDNIQIKKCLLEEEAGIKGPERADDGRKSWKVTSKSNGCQVHLGNIFADCRPDVR